MITADVSAMLKASDGMSVNIFESFSKQEDLAGADAPNTYTIAPLGTRAVNMCDLSYAVYTLLKTTKPVHVTVTFAGTTQPSPATQTILVRDIMLLSAEISAISIFNPNSGVSPDNDAVVDLTLIGA